jgi:hypothetical protein
MDTIYTNHSSTTYDYKDVSAAIYGTAVDMRGGEVIEENLTVWT